MPTKTAKKDHVYGEVTSPTSLKRIFSMIRDDIETAKPRDELTEYYRRAGYLVTLTRSPAWRKKFGSEIGDIQDIAEAEFATTARKANRRAKDIGTEADYDDKWGD